MTDPAPHTEQAAPAAAADATPMPARRESARNGRALPALALLLGAGGLLLAGWSLWQVRSLQGATAQQQSRLEEARSQTLGLAERDLVMNRQLAQLPSPAELEERRRLLADLQAEQQRLSQRVDSVLGASRQEWRLAEAEHLLRLASLRLSALQDVNSARFLVSTADQILRDHDDPAAFAARAQLARGLEALRSLPVIDRTGLYLQLAALGAQAAQLNTRQPEFEAVQGAGVPQVAEGDGSSRWAEWWQRLSGFVRLEFTASDEVKPLLAGQTLEQLRLALRLAVEQAQWAVLNAQPEVYRTALDQARALVERYFGLDSPQTQALHGRFAELAGQPVAQELPDLTPALNALQAYLAQRERAELEAAGARPADTVPAAEPAEAVAPAPAAAPAVAPEAPAEARP
ncbi:uroporphyrinogen-III C-methyltransferase [Geopseudomonas aromaticivorans]